MQELSEENVVEMTVENVGHRVTKQRGDIPVHTYGGMLALKTAFRGYLNWQLKDLIQFC